MTTPERLQDVIAEMRGYFRDGDDLHGHDTDTNADRHMQANAWADRIEAAAALSGQQVPADGEWVLVPRDPTPEMIEAGIMFGTSPNKACIIYQSMLAATPQAPQPVVDGDVSRALEWVREVGAPFTQEERAMLDCIEEAIAAYDPSQVGARTVKRATEAKQAAVMYADEAFSQAVPAAFLDMLGGSSEGLAPAYISKYVVPLFTHPAPIDRDAIEILRAFERKFWQAVNLTDSRDFDHDVCKEVRDFRDVIAALAAHGKGG